MDDATLAALSPESSLPLLAPHLSRHLLFPLLEFEEKAAEERGDDEAARSILRAKLSLLADTNMTNYVADLHKAVHGTVPADADAREKSVMSQLEHLEKETAVITDLLQQEDVLSGLRSDKVANLEYLQKDHAVTIDMVNALYDLGQFHFRCGNYGDAADLLYRFRVLSTDNDRVAAATWGKLACEVLNANWEVAVEELLKVKESIENKLFGNPRSQLDHRTMLVHWALFPLFNSDAARDPVVEMFLSPAYINTILAACPWVLRYLAAAVICPRAAAGGARGRGGPTAQQQKQLKDVVRYVRQEQYEYSDPITAFVAALYVAHDFDAAREALRNAGTACAADFFLAGSATQFVEAARHLVCESYCKIYSRIDMRDLSSKLGLDPDREGEKWIVNLIRDTRLDAKIDSKQGTVIMNHPPNNIYQSVIERTKGGFFRTQVLTAAVSK